MIGHSYTDLTMSDIYSILKCSIKVVDDSLIGWSKSKIQDHLQSTTTS